MSIQWLEPDEKPEVFWHSSISQKKNTLSVLVRGEWLPISFDSLDYIECSNDSETKGCGKLHPVSHKAILTDGDDLGFDYSVGECKYITDLFVTHDHQEVVELDLPEWYGIGKYKAFIDKRAYVNDDNSALGVRTIGIRRVGLAYALAKRTLEADDPE